MKRPKPIPGLLGGVFTGKEKVPAMVDVLDCKYGNVIGYRSRKEVSQLLQEEKLLTKNMDKSVQDYNTF